MKSFDIKTKIYFGDQALDRLEEIPYQKILVVTDRNTDYERNRIRSNVICRCNRSGRAGEIPACGSFTDAG